MHLFKHCFPPLMLGMTYIKFNVLYNNIVNAVTRSRQDVMKDPFVEISQKGILSRFQNAITDMTLYMINILR